jgi:uncharacterized membrane-anchored protein YhcB (DUF1043 family)
MEIEFIVIGLAAGFLLGFLFFRLKQQTGENEWVKTSAQLEERLRNLQSENEKLADNANISSFK